MKTVYILTQYQSISVTCDDASADDLFKNACKEMGGYGSVAWKGNLGEGSIRASQIVGVTINLKVGS